MFLINYKKIRIVFYIMKKHIIYSNLCNVAVKKLVIILLNSVFIFYLCLSAQRQKQLNAQGSCFLLFGKVRVRGVDRRGLQTAIKNLTKCIPTPLGAVKRPRNTFSLFPETLSHSLDSVSEKLHPKLL